MVPASARQARPGWAIRRMEQLRPTIPGWYCLPTTRRPAALVVVSSVCLPAVSYCRLARLRKTTIRCARCVPPVIISAARIQFGSASRGSWPRAPTKWFLWAPAAPNCPPAARPKPTRRKLANQLSRKKKRPRSSRPGDRWCSSRSACSPRSAANLYLGWVALGVYRRYREVVAQLHRVQTSLA